MTELESIMEKLTDKQARVLEFIRDRINRQGCPPTVREIARQFRFASTSTARAHLLALEKKGFLERSFHASRGIRLARELAEHAGLPIVGRVAAGTPILANPGLDGVGETASGFLEMSNVETVEELVSMISAQRAYELNSKTITMADEMLRIVNGLKR